MYLKLAKKVFIFIETHGQLYLDFVLKYTNSEMYSEK